MGGDNSRNCECNGTMPVTAKISGYLREQGFQGFSKDTHFVAMPHMVQDVVDWVSALIDLGIPAKNIHLLGKQYSQVDSTRDKLLKMGVDICDYTPAPVGKYYETIQNVDLPKFWEHTMHSLRQHEKSGSTPKIIVMDDGGRLLRSIPQELLDKNPQIVGIEQTTNGFDVLREEGHGIDIVIPAMSALKLEFEPSFIADAAIRKLRDKLGIFRNRDVGIVGHGKIGGALAETLADNHNNIFVYDKAVQITDGILSDPNHLLPPEANIYQAPAPGQRKEDAVLLRAGAANNNINYYLCTSLEQIVQNSNYVFGCTGKDIFKDIDLNRMDFNSPNKTIDETRFISTSSGDKEFRSLLGWMAAQGCNHHRSDIKNGSRWDVTLRHGESRIRVLQQGFPINFDGKTGSGTPEEMQLISSFLLGAIVQGYEHMQRHHKEVGDESKLLMFSPAVQRKILFSWLDGVPSIQGLYPPQKIEKIRNDATWFAKFSHGHFIAVFNDDLPTPTCMADRVKQIAPVENLERWRHGN